jgi:hypothetical protein
VNGVPLTAIRSPRIWFSHSMIDPCAGQAWSSGPGFGGDG